MKRIVLLTDPARINENLVRRLRRFFPECEVQIVAVAETGVGSEPRAAHSGLHSPHCR